MEAELKFTYKKGFTYFDIIESPFIANNLLQSSITSYAMRSSYFDTSDEFFRKRRAVFRLRRQNERYYLTLKLSIPKRLETGEGIFEREEFEFELQERDKNIDLGLGINPEWFLSRLNETQEKSNRDLLQILKMAENRPLSEVCLADFTRTAYVFSFRTSKFEICFDEGYLGTSEKIEQFSELEFELLLGKIEDLIALRGILLEHLPLIPMEKSKYGRAIAIADQLK
ncbi:MAG: CYTH domain-containing protein [Clostridiaceae bacterium]|nr:CYTH domain-containing protein [Clostridiaceae bacterium]